jgi:DNA-binding transcriptional MerR regulator
MSTITTAPPKTKQKALTAYRTIGEVSSNINIPQHVLRFWESKFSNIKPYKNNGRRYYSQEDVEIILRIKTMLHDLGYTIKGVQNLLMEQQKAKTLKQKQLSLLQEEDLSQKTLEQKVTSSSKKIVDHKILAQVVSRLEVAKKKLLELVEV